MLNPRHSCSNCNRFDLEYSLYTHNKHHIVDQSRRDRIVAQTIQKMESNKNLY